MLIMILILMLIDFDCVQKNKTKAAYKGSMGWSAPEINYNSKKNMYHSSADIFSLGLVILYLMFGWQPLQISAEKSGLYTINSGDSKEQI